MAEAVSESITTKADLLELELRLTEKFDTKLDALDKKFEAKFDALDKKIDTIDAKFDAKFDALNNRLLVGALSIVAALVASIAGATFTLVQLLK